MKKIAYSTLLLSALALGACTEAPEGPAESGAAEGGEKGAEGGAKLVSWSDLDDSMNEEVKKVGGERFRIEFDGEDMLKGDAEPLVVIVEFSDFQCPYCSRFTNTLKEVTKGYDKDVAVVFKQFPLTSIHPDAMGAAQAALAANEQGKGWELHDKMFDGQKQKLTRENIEKWAGEVGVQDMDKFKKALDDKKFEQAVKDDMAYAMKMAVNSTPTFFVNGRMVQNRSVDSIKAVIDEEIKLGNTLVEKGAKRNEVYGRIMRAAKAERKVERPKPKPRPGQPSPETNYAVPTDGRAQFGKDDALVTIVEFSDFQCPFCNRVNPTIKKIKETYPDDVRIVFRQLPLPMHPQAPNAARASIAANNQGKFWEMHDKMFANQRALTDDKLEAYATEIGLDVAKFKTDMSSDATKKMVDEDMKVAQQFGARGTPAFFINGRFINGAQPFEAFDTIIKAEKDKAAKFKADKGVAGKDLYAEMSKGWEKEVKIPPPPPPADFKRREVKTDGLEYKKGNLKDPKITILECSDFDCPFCKRGAGTIKQVMDEYGDKVALYYAHKPLPMHKQAEPAHRAAIAAGKQGKFWEMHDLLFANQKSRTEADFVKFATDIGLDVDKFKADWASAEAKTEVTEQTKMCEGLGVGGVPGFIINGRLMRGAQPWPRFKEVLDEELNGGFEATQKKKKEEEAKKAG